MGNSYIGIKLADGSFFPVVEEFAKIKKRLILTTIRDNQSSMQINLYKSSSEESTDTEISLDDADSTFVAGTEEPIYVGSLIIEDIEQSTKGTPSVSLVLGFDKENNLSAEAVDLDSGNHQSLTTAITSLALENRFDFPDFDVTDVKDNLDIDDLDNENFVSETFSSDTFSSTSTDTDLETDDLFLDTEKTFVNTESNFENDFQESTNPPNALFETENSIREKKHSRIPGWLSVTLFVIGLLALILALLLLFPTYKTFGWNGIKEILFGSSITAQKIELPESLDKNTDNSDNIILPEDEATQIEKTNTSTSLPTEFDLACGFLELTPVTKESPVELPKVVLSNDTSIIEEKTEGKAVSKKEEKPVKKAEENKKYKIKWGDTLWDIADAYYKNPWKYKQLARFNKIKNPDYIISGTYVLIPPR